MSAELLIANMLRIAKEDLDGAALLASRSNRNAAYLCEQAAEKVIRAILTSEGKHAGIRHRLDEMVDLVPDENPMKAALREIEDLASYATAYRYPTSSGRIPEGPGGRDLQVLLAQVAATLQETAARFDVDLSRKGQPAGRSGPIR